MEKALNPLSLYPKDLQLLAATRTWIQPSERIAVGRGKPDRPRIRVRELQSDKKRCRACGVVRVGQTRSISRPGQSARQLPGSGYFLKTRYRLLLQNEPDHIGLAFHAHFFADSLHVCTHCVLAYFVLQGVFRCSKAIA